MSAAMQTKSFSFDRAMQHRVLALLLLAIVVLAIIAAVAAPAWWLYHRYDEATDRMARQQKSYASLNLLRPKLQQGVDILKARDTKKYFLKNAATAVLAGTDLLEVTKNLIEGNNGRLLSSQLLPHKDENGYRLVNANIQMTANIQNFRKVLYDLDGRVPYLFVDNLTIRAQVPPGYKPQPGFEPDMFIQFDVTGVTPIAPIEAPAESTDSKTKPATKPATAAATGAAP